MVKLPADVIKAIKHLNEVLDKHAGAYLTIVGIDHAPIWGGPYKPQIVDHGEEMLSVDVFVVGNQNLSDYEDVKVWEE